MADDVVLNKAAFIERCVAPLVKNMKLTPKAFQPISHVKMLPYSISNALAKRVWTWVNISFAASL
jgi:hypothetical protein